MASASLTRHSQRHTARHINLCQTILASHFAHTNGRSFDMGMGLNSTKRFFDESSVAVMERVVNSARNTKALERDATPSYSRSI